LKKQPAKLLQTDRIGVEEVVWWWGGERKKRGGKRKESFERGHMLHTP
jgi:hypothetical protein